MVKRVLKSRLKESVTFSAATRDHIVNVLKLKLDALKSKAHFLSLPTGFVRPIISNTLHESLVYLAKPNKLETEAGRSDVIKAFMREAAEQVNTDLELLPEFPLSWKQNGLRFNGFIDLVMTNDDKSSILLVVEAKNGWQANLGVFQLLAEAGCLLRSREKIGKKTPVFAILSDGCHFKFFAIDERDGAVYSFPFIAAELPLISDYKSNPQVIEIVSWIMWLVFCICSDFA